MDSTSSHQRQLYSCDIDDKVRLIQHGDSAADMTIKRALMNGITLGGYEDFTAAQAEYLKVYEEYTASRCDVVYAQEKFDKKLAEFGRFTAGNLRVLKRARRLIAAAQLARTKRNLPTKFLTRGSLNGVRLSRIDLLVSDYNSAFSILGGVGAGSAIAIGSWSLVGMAGAASTGTAISTIYGAAASNATLAWFGGGSLATGGLGMAGGTAVLGGLAAAPVIAFVSWQSRTKTKQIREETAKIRLETDAIRSALEKLRDEAGAVEALQSAVLPLSQSMKDAYLAARRSLLPLGIFSYALRYVRRGFGYQFYSREELKTINALEEVANAFVICFRRGGKPSR